VNSPGTRRMREANTFTLVLAVPCVLAVLGSVVPGVDDLVTRVLVVLVVLVGVLGVTARYIRRWVRERREDRADAITAAAWRAAHSRCLDRRQQDQRSRAARSGVA
jgi:hypothetical protein